MTPKAHRKALRKLMQRPFNMAQGNTADHCYHLSRAAYASYVLALWTTKPGPEEIFKVRISIQAAHNARLAAKYHGRLLP